ncbi:MAG TPA: DUF6788 family protein [Isosphaeraceae bacterium]|nr:DUF6788 family protein [Isosphaeraceae bacterium]
MTPRWHRSLEERQARSRAVQLLADQPLIRGSLVLQHRSCGKPYCRCRRGQKHPALYLHTRSVDGRVRIYIPPALHDTTRQWVDNGRRVKRLIDRVSQHHLQALLERKQEIAARKGRPRPEAPAP